MNGEQKLILEVLNGPLDGAVLVLDKETEWTRDGQGPLSFPWDDELGAPQARFRLDAGAWHVEGYQAPHGTYRLNGPAKITEAVAVQAGDVLKASNTWLRVRGIE